MGHFMDGELVQKLLKFQLENHKCHTNETYHYDVSS